MSEGPTSVCERAARTVRAAFGPRLVRIAVMCSFALLSSFRIGVQPEAIAQREPSHAELVHRWQMLLVKDPNDVKRAVTSGQPTLLAFVDKRCGDCLAMVPVIEELQHDYAGRLNIATVDNEQAQVSVRLLLKEYQVWAVPMFVVLNRQGQIHRKLYGPQAKPRLVRILEDVLGPS